MVSGAEALKVHRLIDALLEAGASGQRVKVVRFVAACAERHAGPISQSRR